jgi:UDP-N-acetylglucosamine acyltransferase
MGPSRIGSDNRIFQFASIGDAPQDKKYQGEPTSLELGDRNIIREYVTLNRGTDEGNGKTVIGSDNLFMAYSHVAHDCIVGSHTIFANAASLSGHVEVGDYAILGGFTSVHQFTQIGSRAFCGLGSVITQDIPPFSTAAGNRARVIGINKEGLKRRGFSDDLIRALHKSFRELLKARGSREETFARLQPLCDQYPEVDEFVSFVRNSRRGIAS